MNAPIDTLAFAERFEGAGFDHEQARLLAAAFGQAQDAAHDGFVTKADLDVRLAEFEARMNKQFGDLEARMNKQFGDLEARMNKQFGDLEVRLTRHLGEVGRDLSNRLWSTVTIVAGVSTAISATISAVVALILRSKGL